MLQIHRFVRKAERESRIFVFLKDVDSGKNSPVDVLASVDHSLFHYLVWIPNLPLCGLEKLNPFEIAIGKGGETLAQFFGGPCLRESVRLQFRLRSVPCLP